MLVYSQKALIELPRLCPRSLTRQPPKYLLLVHYDKEAFNRVP